ncbi:MAG: hypothetical protein ACK5MR_17335, partial [Cumulibacter sp.]
MTKDGTKDWLSDVKADALTIDENSHLVEIDAFRAGSTLVFGAVPEGWEVHINRAGDGRPTTFESAGQAKGVTWHLHGAGARGVTLAARMTGVYVYPKHGHQVHVTLSRVKNKLHLEPGAYRVDSTAGSETPVSYSVTPIAGKTGNLTMTGSAAMSGLGGTLQGSLTVNKVANGTTLEDFTGALTVREDAQDLVVRGSGVVILGGEVRGAVDVEADRIDAHTVAATGRLGARVVKVHGDLDGTGDRLRLEVTETGWVSGRTTNVDFSGGSEGSTATVTLGLAKPEHVMDARVPAVSDTPTPVASVNSASTTKSAEVSGCTFSGFLDL